MSFLSRIMSTTLVAQHSRLSLPPSHPTVRYIYTPRTSLANIPSTSPTPFFYLIQGKRTVGKCERQGGIAHKRNTTHAKGPRLTVLLNPTLPLPTPCLPLPYYVVILDETRLWVAVARFVDARLSHHLLYTKLGRPLLVGCLSYYFSRSRRVFFAQLTSTNSPIDSLVVPRLTAHSCLVPHTHLPLGNFAYCIVRCAVSSRLPRLLPDVGTLPRRQVQTRT